MYLVPSITSPDTHFYVVDPSQRTPTAMLDRPMLYLSTDGWYVEVSVGTRPLLGPYASTELALDALTNAL